MVIKKPDVGVYVYTRSVYCNVLFVVKRKIQKQKKQKNKTSVVKQDILSGHDTD
jgi:hypothetical protein